MAARKAAPKARQRKRLADKRSGPNLPPELSSPEDVEIALRSLGDTLRGIEKITQKRDTRTARIQEQFETEYAPLAYRSRDIARKILRYAEAHRGELTRAHARKFAAFIQGKVRWQQSSRLDVAVDAAQIIAALKAQNLYEKFVRVSEDLDRQALLQERNRASWKEIEGLAVHERELFYIEPTDTELFVRHDPDLKEQPWNLDRKKKKVG